MSCTKKQKSENETLIAWPTGSPDPTTGKRSINYWPSLSDEVVLLILRLLPLEDLVTVSRLNRRFRHLSKDSSLWDWMELNLDLENLKQNAESCRKLVDKCEKLTLLKITNKSKSCDKISQNIMTVVLKAKQTLNCFVVDPTIAVWTPAAMSKLGSMKNLTKLSLCFNQNLLTSVNSYAGAEMLEELKNLDKLEVLNLMFGNYRSNYIESFKVMERVFQTLRKLKEVKLYPANYGEDLVISLAENNPDLKVIWNMNFSSLSNETIEVLINSCPCLENFIISSSHSENEINKLSSSWPNLKCLDVRHRGLSLFSGILLKDEKLIEYAERFRRLERLSLAHIPYINITDSGIERLVGSAEKLKYLSLVAPKVTRNLVKRLRTKYPSLDLRINNY